VIRDAVQTAPVAVLWPIRSFQATNEDWKGEDPPMRRELASLIVGCLENQVGVHLIDEADLQDVNLNSSGELALGRARYQHLVVPPSLVLHSQTVLKLKHLHDNGFNVVSVGSQPLYQEFDDSLNSLDMSWCCNLSITEAIDSLPRIIELKTYSGNSAMVRCSQWSRGSLNRTLIMNIGEQSFRGCANGVEVELAPDELRIID